METYSKRFQHTRISASAADIKSSQNARSKSSLDGQEWHIEPLLNKSQYKPQTLTQESRSKHWNPILLLYSLAKIPVVLYAFLLTCVRGIIKYIQTITCQNPQQNATAKSTVLSPTTLENNKNNVRKYYVNDTLNHSWRKDSSALFSSDSEDEDIYGSVLTETQTLGQHGTHCHVDNCSFEDDELTFVRLIDNVIYFIHLYFTNYPAFSQEVSQSFRNLGNPSRKVVYGHNLNPKEKRLKIIKKGIEFLKRRKFRENMTRAYGNAHKRWVSRIALASRLLIFIMQLILTNLPQTFKHNNDGFKFTPEETYGKLLDRLVNSTMGGIVFVQGLCGYINWDAHYFLHISVYGYTSENLLAFFPLLPMLLYCPSRILYFLLQNVISLSSVVIIVGTLLNTWLFTKCVENIYDIAQLRAEATQQLITAACLMFSFNPASIFFSGLYTETLFAYLTSSVFLYNLQRKTRLSLTFAAFSCLCRSNGILNVGFILALQLQDELRDAKLHKIFSFGVWSVAKLIYTLVPFLLFQKYGIATFCSKGKVYEDPTEVPLYCIENKKFIGIQSLPYSYIQKKYWNVGLLEYFEFKQIPNFILAAPVLYVLGTRSWKTLTFTVSKMISKMDFQHIYGLFHAVHGLFLTVFCLLYVHVQVSTRMIMAGCPYLYVHVAAAHVLEVEKFRNKEISLPITSLGITLWCIVYYIIGTIGFSLGFPWT